MSKFNLVVLESREQSNAFVPVFSDDPYLTDARKLVISTVMAEWGAVIADDLPPITQTWSALSAHGGFLEQNAPVVAARTYRVYVGLGPTVSREAIAEANPLTYSAVGGYLPRNPGGELRFNYQKLPDDDVLAVITFHEVGHILGLDHQPVETPPESRTFMYPFVSGIPKTDHLTGLDLRDALWAGHELAPGTVITGIGVQRPGHVDGWMVYRPHDEV